MKKSIIAVLMLFIASFVLSTAVSCNPDRGEEGYVVPEDDGPESTLQDASDLDLD